MKGAPKRRADRLHHLPQRERERAAPLLPKRREGGTSPKEGKKTAPHQKKKREEGITTCRRNRKAPPRHRTREKKHHPQEGADHAVPSSLGGDAFPFGWGCFLPPRFGRRKRGKREEEGGGERGAISPPPFWGVGLFSFPDLQARSAHILSDLRS